QRLDPPAGELGLRDEAARAAGADQRRVVDALAAGREDDRILTRRRRPIVLNRRVSFAVLNPATEETIAEFDEAGVEETDAAVARAKAAFPAWRAVAPADRARLLRRVATLVEEHAEELALIESRNVGKPVGGARAE